MFVTEEWDFIVSLEDEEPWTNTQHVTMVTANFSASDIPDYAAVFITQYKTKNMDFLQAHMDIYL